MSSNSAVELKGSMYTFLSLKLHSNDVKGVAEALADKVQQAPGFFANTPVVVDLTEIEGESGTDASALLAVIREQKLVPVVASIRDKDSEFASQIDIPLVEAGSKKKKRRRGKKQADEKSTGNTDKQADSSAEQAAEDNNADSPSQGSAADHNQDNTQDTTQENRNDSWNETNADDTSDATGHDATGAAALSATVSEVEYIVKSPKLVTKPVRSGQQVYARDTDLVVIGGVGPGAEIIADNNVHVYGPLRGRALCGVAGNTEARIFCRSLEAELVSVAGNYKVLEQIPEELRGKPAQIWYENDKLMIEPL